MRPRPDAAENMGDFARPIAHWHASMRPRPDAAENVDLRFAQDVRPRRFNEAAARCRGKLPRSVPIHPAARGFNEAAARCRGKPTSALNFLALPP